MIVHTYRKKSSAFTLVEMLIVIVIIGILGAALIPRLINIQARARDTIRTADLKNIAVAVELYRVDNEYYPLPQYATIATVPRQVSFHDLLIPSVSAQTVGSTLDTLAGDIFSQYLKSLPSDPRGLGVAKADGSSACAQVGNSYAYDSDGGSYYAITSISEANKGNAATCGYTIDRNNDGAYKKVGEGLIENIYPGPSQWTNSAFFIFESGTILGYEGSTDVVIPEMINGMPVERIGGSAFLDKGIRSVMIPYTVKTIDTRGFNYNKIASLTIPSSVTSIGNSAFGNNNTLTSITFDGTGLVTLGHSTFHSSRLQSVTIPSSIDTIVEGMFSYGGLSSITIPDNIKYIGDNAFRGNKITTITISKSVETLGNNAFLGNGPNKNSQNITDFVSNTDQTRILPAGTTEWVKQ